jgi:hypothetical protein
VADVPVAIDGEQKFSAGLGTQLLAVIDEEQSFAAGGGTDIVAIDEQNALTTRGGADVGLGMEQWDRAQKQAAEPHEQEKGRPVPHRN